MCNGCNSVSFGNHGVPEGDRIPSLKSHGKELKQESGFPGVFCDCGDASADLLCQLYRHLMPHTSCFHGKGIEDMTVCCSVQHSCLSSPVPMSGLHHLA